MEIFAIHRQQPSLDASITLDVVRPGVVQVGVGIFRSFIVFSGRSATQVVATGHVDLAHSVFVALQKSLPSGDMIETQAVWREALALEDIARGVRSTGHGGALLLVPDDNNEWTHSIDPFRFRLQAVDTVIADSIRLDLARAQQSTKALGVIFASDLSEAEKNAATATVSSRNFVDRGAIEAIARLAAVDGAVVLTASAGLVGFGAKISVESADVPLASMGPGHGSEELIRCELEDLGGTRHQSAARFVARNQNCAAVVVSSDGPMSFLSWHRKAQCVRVVRNVDWWV